MATVKEIYQLIKEREKQGKKIGILQQSIIDAYEDDEPKVSREISSTFIKKKKIEGMMATVKELYDYIKLQIKLGKPITPFHQAIVDACEADQIKTIKQLNIDFINKKK